MANITFTIDENIRKRMKNHPEVKWTEIMRRAILEYLTKIEEPEEMTSEEFREQLSPETLKLLADLEARNTSLEEELEIHEKVHKMDEKRMKLIQETEQGEK